MGHDYFRGDGSSPLFLGLRAKSHPISATAAQRNYPSGGDDGLRLAMTRPEHSVAGEQRDLIDISIASTASSMSMLPFNLRRPAASTYSLVGLVTTV